MNSECYPVRDLIADSVTGALSTEQARHLHEHLRGCPDCRSYAEALRREDRLLGQLVAGVAADMPGREEQLVQVLSHPQSKRTNYRRGWRRITNRWLARLIAAAVVVLAAALGLSMLEKSSPPAYGVTEALDLIAQAKTLHIQGWRIDRREAPLQEIRAPFEHWYDLENGRYRIHTTSLFAGQIYESFHVCDGEYVMRSGAYQPVGDRVHHTIEFEKADPTRKNDVRWLEWYRQLRRIEGFAKVRQDTLDGETFDVWQGEYTYGVGDRVTGHRLQVWLSPATARVGAIKVWEEQNGGGWNQVWEYTRFERDLPLAAELFKTEPPATGYEIKNSKETATVPVRRGPLEVDIYENTKFAYASLNYWVAPVFALRDGSLVAGYQSVDAKEPRDQSRYFQGLQVGGPLAKLPVEVYALAPEPNTRSVTFLGFHLAHTQKQTPNGPRWFEWILYVPNGTPPKPEAVLLYRIQYRLNVQRTEDIDISVKQTATPDPQMVETEEDFNRLVLGAMAERSATALPPEQVTYAGVLQMAQQIRATLVK